LRIIFIKVLDINFENNYHLIIQTTIDNHSNFNASSPTRGVFFRLKSGLFLKNNSNLSNNLYNVAFR